MPTASHKWELVDRKYKMVTKKGEGTFSEVYTCQSKDDGRLYALKRMKQKYKSLDKVYGLPEVICLRRLNPHPNIIDMKEVIYDPRSGALALSCELMDLNLYELIKDRSEYLPENIVSSYTFQLLQALDHMHRQDMFHRDIKPENILIRLADNTLKLADFGSSRSVRSEPPYTEYISTRWYRAPECLLTDGYYGTKMDMWSAGCVFYELYRLQPLFPGSSELDQINRIHSVLGTPSKELLRTFRQSRHMSFDFPKDRGVGLGVLMKHSSTVAVDLLSHLCRYDPKQRWSAKDAQLHSFFRERRRSLAAAAAKASTAKHVRRQRQVRVPAESARPQVALPTIANDRVVPVRAARPLKPRVEAASGIAAAAAVASKTYGLPTKGPSELTAVSGYPSHWQQSAKVRRLAKLTSPTMASSVMHATNGMVPTTNGYSVAPPSAAYKELPKLHYIPAHSIHHQMAMAAASPGLSRHPKPSKLPRSLHQPMPVKEAEVRQKKRNPYQGTTGSSVLPPMHPHG